MFKLGLSRGGKRTPQWSKTASTTASDKGGPVCSEFQSNQAPTKGQFHIELLNCMANDFLSILKDLKGGPKSTDPYAPKTILFSQHQGKDAVTTTLICRIHFNRLQLLTMPRLRQFDDMPLELELLCKPTLNLLQYHRILIMCGLIIQVISS